jgi:glycosyltransferase involved in cell wall biosynthesis
MRILVVSTSYPAALADGSEAAGIFVSDFSRALASRTEVTVVCPDLTESIEKGSPEVRRFPVPRLPLASLNPLQPASWPSIISVLSTGLAAVEKAAYDFRPDHIFALWALPSGWWAMRAAKKHRISYSTWSLGSDIWSLGRIPVVRGMLRKVLATADHRFADGLKLCEDVRRISGGSCEFLPSCRDLGIRNPPARRTSPPYRLAFLGRWHPNKGIDLLLDALRLLGADGWQNIEEIRIHGGGPLEEDVKQTCMLLGESGRPVRVGGYLDRDAAASLLAWADFVIIPSRIESIPVVFSDALQSGCRVISTPAGDLPGLIDESIGTVSVDVSAESIRAAVTSAVSRDYGSPGAADRIRPVFDVRAVAGRVLACLEGGA